MRAMIDKNSLLALIGLVSPIMNKIINILFTYIFLAALEILIAVFTDIHNKRTIFNIIRNSQYLK